MRKQKTLKHHERFEGKRTAVLAPKRGSTIIGTTYKMFPLCRYCVKLFPKSPHLFFTSSLYDITASFQITQKSQEWNPLLFASEAYVLTTRTQ
jgi:hypothetical protein